MLQPSPKHAEESSSSGDDDDDAFGSESDDEMTASQWYILCHSRQKKGSSFVDESSLVVRGRASIGYIR